MTNSCCTKCQTSGSNTTCVPKGCKQGPRGSKGDKGPVGNPGSTGAPKMKMSCGLIHGQGSILPFCDILGTDYVPTEDCLLNLDPVTSVLYFYNAGTWEIVDVNNPVVISPAIQFIPLDGATVYHFLDVCADNSQLFKVDTVECNAIDLCESSNDGDMFYDSVTGTFYKVNKSDVCDWVVCGIFQCIV